MNTEQTSENIFTSILHLERKHDQVLLPKYERQKKIIRKLRPIDNKIKNLSDATSNIVLNMELYKGKTIMSGKDFVNSVRYSQKFRRKHGFSNLVNGSTSQFRFPKYLIEYQNVKIE